MRLMMYAFGRNFCLKPFTVTGKVAENRQICLSDGHFAMSASSTGGGGRGVEEGIGIGAVRCRLLLSKL